MLIGTMNEAVAAVNAMNRKELATLTDSIENQGCWSCRDKRKKRDFCVRYIISMWCAARWDMIRLIYNAQEN